MNPGNTNTDVMHGGFDVEIVKASNIISMTQQTFEAFAVACGHIIATGTEAELRDAFPRSPVTNFDTGVLVPGFNDAHIHLAQAADVMLYLDLSHESVGSIKDIKAKISAEARVKEAGSWIRGVRYDDGKTSDGRVLTRADLDAAAPDHRALVVHVSGHWGIANSGALAAGGIGEDSAPPDGGTFGRDGDGKLNGILYERAFFNFAYPRSVPGGKSVMPGPSAEDRLGGLDRAVQMFHSAGLTSVCDALVGPDDVRLFVEGIRRGILSLRVDMLVAAEHYDKMRELGLVGRLGGDRLRICGIKTFVDGAIGGRTCLMEEPFEGTSDDFGIQSTSTHDLRNMIREGHEHGTQLCIHANGDRAIKLVLGLYEEVQNKDPKPYLHHRIEHCTIVNEEIVKRIKNAGIFVTPFGTHVHYYGAKLLDWYGEKRVQRMFAHRWFLDSGIKVGGSSDYPCGEYQPLRAIQGCVTRQGFDGVEIGANQRITVMQALWLYTVGSAMLTGQEHERGRLAPGFVADFAVLERDPRAVGAAQIADIRVLETWVGGKKVWDHRAGAPVAPGHHAH